MDLRQKIGENGLDTPFGKDPCFDLGPALLFGCGGLIVWEIAEGRGVAAGSCVKRVLSNVEDRPDCRDRP